MADTSRDVRLIAAERLITRLRTMVGRRAYGSSKQTAAASRLLEELAGKAAALRYSYMEDADLAAYGDTRALADGARTIAADLKKNPGVPEERLAFLDFFAALLGNLPEAFCGDRSLESLTPVEVGKVTSVEKARQAKNLLRCRVEVFGRPMQIVTNLTKTRSGDLMKVARVPPAEVMGMLSEAQFVGAAEPGARPGERPTLGASEAQEIRRAMGEILDE
jgi:predicted RNA-binding protein with EMAP domain